MTERTATLTVVTAVTVPTTLVALAPSTAAAAPTGHATPGVAAATSPAIATPTPQIGSSLSDTDETVAATAGVLPERTVATVVESVPDETPETVVLVLAGYSRWDDSDPLDHETRRELHDAVVESPGVSLSTVAERTDTNVSTLRHHCRVLEREDLVETDKHHGQRCLFPAVGWTVDDASADHVLAAALEDDTFRTVLRGVYRTEPVSVGDLASELDLAPSTVSHHLGRLADDGLVERQKEGRIVRTSLTPTTRSAIEATAST